MKPKRKQKKLRITEADFMLANRRAARLEEIAAHGRPVSYSALHKSKKVYDRKRLKKAGINSDDLLFSCLGEPVKRVYPTDGRQPGLKVCHYFHINVHSGTSGATLSIFPALAPDL